MNNVQSIEEIFTRRILCIPDYQRGYAWQKAQWDDLREDLELLEGDREHYTGTLVLHAQGQRHKDEEGTSYDVFDIVDGQQRLTTLVLVLDAIRREMKGEERWSKLAEGIRKRYLSVTDLATGQPLFKLQLNPDTHEFFEKKIIADEPGPQEAKILSHKRLTGAKRYFNDYLSSMKQKQGENFDQWLIQFYSKVTSQLKVSLYNVGDAAEVGVIFEVMNDRGKALSELEKVKNYLLYLSSKLNVKGHDLGKAVNKTWARVFERLMVSDIVRSDDEDQLLRAHWRMAHDHRKKNWQGGKSIKARFGLRAYQGRHKDLLDRLLTYTDSLDDASLVYCDILRPSRDEAFSSLASDAKLKRDIVAASEKLPRVDVVAPFLPLLMATRLKYPEDGRRYLQMVQMCEIYAFRVYRLLKFRADTGGPKLARLGNELYRGALSFENAMDHLRGTLLGYCPNERFRERFRLGETNNYWYGWSGLKYFLYEYEEYLAGSKPVRLAWKDVERKDLKDTIEHILPQTATPKYWTSRFDPEDRRLLTHDLGNLCLTLDNSAYSNKPFPQKKGEVGSDKPCYANSILFQEKRLAALENWNKEELLRRREEMVEWAMRRWQVEDAPPEHPEPEEDEGL